MVHMISVRSGVSPRFDKYLDRFEEKDKAIKDFERTGVKRTETQYEYIDNFFAIKEERLIKKEKPPIVAPQRVIPKVAVIPAKPEVTVFKRVTKGVQRERKSNVFQRAWFLYYDVGTISFNTALKRAYRERK
jgi:hypothetical protein